MLLSGCCQGIASKHWTTKSGQRGSCVKNADPVQSLLLYIFSF